MSKAYTTVTASVDLADILSDMTDEDLLAELDARGLTDDGTPAFITREQMLEAYEHCQREPDMALTYIRQMSWAALGRIL